MWGGSGRGRHTYGGSWRRRAPLYEPTTEVLPYFADPLFRFVNARINEDLARADAGNPSAPSARASIVGAFLGRACKMEAMCNAAELVPEVRQRAVRGMGKIRYAR
jgi:hypothetical protein